LWSVRLRPWPRRCRPPRQAADPSRADIPRAGHGERSGAALDARIRPRPHARDRGVVRCPAHWTASGDDRRHAWCRPGAGRRASRSAGGAFCDGAGRCLGHAPDVAGLSAQVARDVHEDKADPVHIARGLSILRDHPGLGRICMSGAPAGSRSPQSIHCSQCRRAAATTAIVDETGWGARFALSN